MLLTLKNEALEVELSTLGAEMQSVTAADGTGYLWYGDPAYWKGRATNLFPMVGRLYGEGYTWKGQRYPLGIHGFARYANHDARDRSNTHVFLETGADEHSLPQYPFPFRAGVDYELEGNTLHITYRVKNTGEETMPFGLGGHPGFRLPLEEGLRFEDYKLCFEGELKRQLVSEAILMTGEEEPFPLEDGCLPLRHDLFDRDAIIVSNPAGVVTLKSDKGKRGLTLRHPQMPYLGIWHKPFTDAPYVCLEPWLSLPGREGVVEALETQPGLHHLAPGEIYENRWSITFF